MLFLDLHKIKFHYFKRTFAPAYSKFQIQQIIYFK